MKDHSKPSLRENPSMKNEVVTIIISNIFIKNDKFKGEVKEVKRHFQILRKERNIF